MNIVFDIVCIIIAALFTAIGFKRGFIKSAIPLLSIVAAVIISCMFFGRLSLILNEKYIEPVVSQKAKDSVAQSIDESEIGNAAEYIRDNNEKLRSLFARWGTDGETVREDVSENETSIGESVAEAIAKPVAETISDVFAFAVVFIISYAAIRLAAVLIGLIFKAPVLKTINKLTGALMSFVCSLLIIWLLSLLISHLLPEIAKTLPDSKILDVENSEIYRWFRDNNVWNIINRYL